MDIESVRYPSWCLCRLLDKIIGTKEVVALRRKRDTMYYYSKNVHTSYNLINSGSRREGFDFQSSDLDTMFSDKNTVVLESIRDPRLIDNSKTVLLMIRDGCNPGFAILKLNRANDLWIRESVVDYRGQPVVSSLLYRDLHEVGKYDQVGHGPCITYQGNTGGDIDVAFCFECDKWPTEASEFIYRQRLYGWPEKSLLDKIICRGCHLVPIGDKNNDLSHIQWRLSFSAAEHDLVHSFNHTQFLVYGLLKIFLKQFIDKFHLLDGILCSYFLKTAMFYSIESTPSYLWREDLLIPCFWFCINKIITWVEQGYCPNYFVPQNNMFRNKVFGQHRHNLLCVLKKCKRVGWKCTYLCKDLQVLQTVVSHPESLYSSGLIPSEIAREFTMDKLATVGMFVINNYTNQDNMLKLFARSLTLFRHSRTQHEEDYSTLLLRNVLTFIGLSGFCVDGNINNKDKYKRRRKYQRLSLHLKEDRGYAELFYMATFYHKTGQYQRAIHLLERVISIWRPFVMYMSIQQGEFYHRDLYQHYVCGRGNSLNAKVRSAFVADIIIAKKEKAFYPAELSYNVEAIAPLNLCLPPLPYTLFLLFLCLHKLGNIDRSLSVLHNLEVLARDKIQGGRQYPVVLNMLAICLDKLGCRHGAVEMCILSQKLKPDRNGVERLLDKILSSWC